MTLHSGILVTIVVVIGVLVFGTLFRARDAVRRARRAVAEASKP